MLTRNLSYRTVANNRNEFLDMALIANERGRCTMLFDAQAVEKRRQHFRDLGSLRISNIAVSGIFGRLCVSVVVHAGIVDGKQHRAKMEKSTGVSNT